MRANAAALLVDAFPLIDPDLRVTEIDERMQQQFDIIEVRTELIQVTLTCLMFRFALIKVVYLLKRFVFSSGGVHHYYSFFS